MNLALQSSDFQGGWSSVPVNTYRYVRIGNLITAFFHFGGFNVSGAGIDLTVPTPDNLVPKATVITKVSVMDNGNDESGQAKVIAGDPKIYIRRAPGVSWSNTSAGNSWASGIIQFEV